MLSTGSLLGKSQARKILFIKAYEDRAQDSRQRQVLQRIVDDLEERKERLDFRILDVIVFPVGNRRNAVFSHDLQKDGAFPATERRRMTISL